MHQRVPHCTCASSTCSSWVSASARGHPPSTAVGSRSFTRSHSRPGQAWLERNPCTSTRWAAAATTKRGGWKTTQRDGRIRKNENELNGELREKTRSLLPLFFYFFFFNYVPLAVPLIWHIRVQHRTGPRTLRRPVLKAGDKLFKFNNLSLEILHFLIAPRLKVLQPCVKIPRKVELFLSFHLR